MDSTLNKGPYPVDDKDEFYYSSRKDGEANDHTGSSYTHIEWVLSRIVNKEPITMPDFAAAFDYACKEDAHAAFLSLLSSTNISQTIRTTLQGKYKVWLRNNGEEYWATRMATSQVRVSTKRTAAELVSAGEHVAKKLIQEQGNNTHGPVKVPSPILLSPSPLSLGASPPFPSTEPPAYPDVKYAASSQSSYQVLSSSPAPPEEYLNEGQLFVLDIAELKGATSAESEQRVHYRLDRFWSLEERWDKRLDRSGLERPDIVFSHNGVTVGCGEIKPFHTSKALIDEDRARLPEFMKRILHERVVGAQTEDEFAVFGFLVSGGEVEISLMRLIDGEYLYKVYTGIVLSSTLGNTDSIAQLLARLYFVRQWITATIPTTVEGPRLFYDRSRLKPTLRLI
ncbi:hypothetical protein BGX34_004766 [Mortierella sp. NVP85]|nr:hypothetical protein BGX34_004766 [Mortierella sp. NVP85]